MAPAASPVIPALTPGGSPLVLAPVLWESATKVELGTSPLLVWIGDGTRADEASRERFIFSVPKTNLGSHAFRLLRIRAADAAKDARLATWARAAGPTLVAISADGSRVKSIAAESMAPRPVWLAMKEVTAATFADDLEQVVATARLNLEETERLDTERRQLALARLAESDRQARLAAIERRRAELEAQLLALWTLHPRKSA